jgi:hypothetical protein
MDLVSSADRRREKRVYRSTFAGSVVPWFGLGLVGLVAAGIALALR